MTSHPLLTDISIEAPSRSCLPATTATSRYSRCVSPASFCDTLSMNRHRIRICARDSGTTTRACTILLVHSLSPRVAGSYRHLLLQSPGVAKKRCFVVCMLSLCMNSSLIVSDMCLSLCYASLPRAYLPESTVGTCVSYMAFFSLGRSALNTLNKMLGIEETSWDVGRARSHLALSN